MNPFHKRDSRLLRLTKTNLNVEEVNHAITKKHEKICETIRLIESSVNETHCDGTGHAGFSHRSRPHRSSAASRVEGGGFGYRRRQLFLSLYHWRATHIQTRLHEYFRF